MGVRLNQFIDRCIEIANGRGLSQTHPIILRIQEPTVSQSTYIAVSFTEPHDFILPSNVTWIDADPNSPDFFLAFKRESRIPQDGFNNTWVQLDTYEQIFDPPQFFDPIDNPIPVFVEGEGSFSSEQLEQKVNRSGDTLEGPLNTRQLPEGEQWDDDEVFPTGFLRSELNRNSQGFFAILSQFNRRLGAVEALALDNKRRLDELGDFTGGDGTNGISRQEFDDLADSVNSNTQQLNTIGITDVGDSGNDDARITQLEQSVTVLQNSSGTTDLTEINNRIQQIEEQLSDIGTPDQGDSGQDVTLIQNLENELNRLNQAVINLQNNSGGSGTGSGVVSFIHTQSIAQDEWTVEHNLGTTNWIAMVRDQDGDTIVADQQLSIDENNLIVTFAEAITGSVLLIAL